MPEQLINSIAYIPIPSHPIRLCTNYTYTAPSRKCNPRVKSKANFVQSISRAIKANELENMNGFMRS